MKRHQIWLAVLALAGTAAHGADAVSEALAAADPPQRLALVRTQNQAQADSEIAIVQAQQAWRALYERFGAHPLPPYDRDPGFLDTLTDISELYDIAQRQVRARQLAQAHQTLEKARALIGELRRRNGVIGYGDHLDAYHAEIEALLDEAPRLTPRSQGPLLLMARVGRLELLSARLRREAGASARADAGFAPALQAVEASVAALRQAVLSQDAGRIQVALQGLRGPYSQLFLRLGQPSNRTDPLAGLPGPGRAGREEGRAAWAPELGEPIELEASPAQPLRFGNR